MSTIDCSNTGNDLQKKNACNCQNALDKLYQALTDYENNMKTYNKNFDHYNEMTQRYNDWTNKTGAFYMFKAPYDALANEGRWGKCAAWPAVSSGSHDGWCNSDLGTSGWIDANEPGGHGCGPGFGSLTCKRSPSQVDIDFNKEHPEYQAVKPKVPAKPDMPYAPTGNNIECCSQIFNDIKASDVKFNNVMQQCQQTINQSFNNNNSTLSIQSSNTQQPYTSVPNSSNSTSVFGSDSTLGIISIVSSVCSCIVIIILIIVLIMYSKK
jgi:hypothetical protein